MTYDKLNQEIFQFDYSNIKSNESMKDVLIQPYGFCKILTHSKVPPKAVVIESKQSLRFMIVDPNTAGNLRIDEYLGDSARMIPASADNMNIIKHYLASFEIQDNKIHDGYKCKDYSQKEGESYGKCLEICMKKKLTAVYGCLPPWFPNDGVGEGILMTHERA